MSCADPERIGTPRLDEDLFKIILVNEAVFLSVVREHFELIDGE